MKIILLLVAITGHGVSASGVEFNTFEACRQAAQQVMSIEAYGYLGSGPKFSALCVLKGEE